MARASVRSHTATAAAPESGLSVWDDRGERHEHTLEGDGPIQLGRSRDCDITLDHEQVSRRHAELVRDGVGRWWLHDSGSRNGIIVAGMRAAGPVLLSAGATASIGPFRLQVHGPASTTPEEESTLVHTSNDAHGSSITALPAAPDKLDAGVLARLHRLDQWLVELETPADRHRRVCDFVLEENDGAQFCAVVTAGPDNDWSSQVAVLQSAARDTFRPPYLSRTLLETVASTRKPMLLSSQGSSAGAGDLMLSIADSSEAISAIACPLEDRTDGPLFYATFRAEAAGQSWIDLMVLVADQYRHAQALLQVMNQGREQALIERDLHRARDIQTGLLPASQRFGDLEVAIGFIPCRFVGGDYVDMLALPDGRVLVAIADVAGKGLPAALISSSIHTMVHAVAKTGGSLTDVMNQLNAYLSDFAPVGVFATMILMAVDPKTGEAAWINAGHPPAVCLKQDGSAGLITDAEYLPLGIDPQDYHVAKGTLNHGDTWVLYTDGLNEMTPPGGTMLGIEGVRDLAQKQRGDTATATADNLVAWLNATGEGIEQGDDQTLVVLGR